MLGHGTHIFFKNRQSHLYHENNRFRSCPDLQLSSSYSFACFVALVVMSVHSLLFRVIPIISDNDMPQCHKAMANYYTA